MWVMHKHIFFVGAIAAFCGGIGIGVFVPAWAWFVCGAVTLLLLFVLLAAPQFMRGVFVFCVLGALALGVYRGVVRDAWAHAPRVYTGAHAELYGVARTDAAVGAFEQRVLVRVRSCSVEGAPVCPLRNLLVRTDAYERRITMRTGVHVTCTLAAVQNFTPDFDYVMYLAAKGVRYECRADTVDAWESPLLRDTLFLLLARVRMYFEERLTHAVVQPQAALAAGLLFGGDERLSEAWQQKFALTGLTHIVAVSGYNVTVIAHALILLGIWVGLWRRHSVWLALGGVVLFVVMIGAPSPAVRAGVMGVTVLLLMRGGRMGSALPALLFAAAVMLAVNPLLVRYDIGFQLSFLATLGIIVFYPLLERTRMGRVRALGLAEIIMVTTSAQVFVVPLIAYQFHTFAVMSLVANVLVLPLIPVAMALTVVVLIVGSVSTTLLMWGGWAIALVLAWVFDVVAFFASMPWAQVTFETVPAWWLVLWYGGVGGILVIGFKRRERCYHREKL